MTTVIVPRDLPQGAKYVATPSFTLAQTIAAMAAEHRDIAGFFGNAGTGKTTALTYFVDHTDRECLYLTAEPSPQRKEIFEQILLATAGGFDPKMSTRELRRTCHEVLAERPRVLIIDECQYLSLLWHQQLRSLHMDPAADFALFLAGGENTVRTLRKDPMLWTRIKLRVYFEPLTDEVLLGTLAEFHPLLANTDPSLLAEIDAKHCNGNFRTWAQIVEVAAPLAAKTRTPDRLTEKVVRAVFTLMGVNWKGRR
jgi:type II secretory pathway predicted ATPase ExeA